jgi:anaphase-promoting complex subunit 1
VRSVVDTLEQSGPTALLQDDPVFDTLKQSFINIWTGACFALGLRFAGSANADAAHVIRKQLLWFMKLQKVQSTKGDRIMMETCISNLALSYAMVMAGTGDIDAFRVLRKLRKRVGHELNYGHHMAIGMAIGLLFLGAGRCVTDPCACYGNLLTLFLQSLPKYFKQGHRSAIDCFLPKLSWSHY